MSLPLRWDEALTPNLGFEKKKKKKKEKMSQQRPLLLSLQVSALLAS